MIRKTLSLLLATALLLCCFTGCSTVSDIAGSVANAAKQELERQIQATLEKHKLEVLELKTAAGKLNNDGGELQFYSAALIRANSLDIPDACVVALDALFEVAALEKQTQSKINSPYLVHKELTFDFSGFDDGSDYYILYVYISDISIKFPEVTKPSEI